jgi:hypothetical protein
MATVPTFGRVAESCLPAGRRCERSTEPDAPPHRSGADRRPTYSTHAKIADTDESTNPPRDQQITGVTGLAIVDAILQGERDPAVLAKLRDH